MPTFNRAKELPRAVRSVLSQTVKDLELIIVDDASSDNTEEVISRFKDDRIHYKKLPKNVGGAEARNVGIRMARADLVAFQDSDDEWTCAKLAQSLDELEADKKIGAIFTSYIQISGDNCRLMPVGKNRFQHSNAYESLLWQNYVGTPSLVVKKKYLNEVKGFDASMPRYQDWDLSLRLSKIASFKYLKEPTLLAYVTRGSITGNSEAHRIALERIYEVHRNAINENKALKAAWLHRIGDAQMSTGVLSGRRLLFNALRCEPFNIRYLVKFLFSMLGRATVYNNLTKPFKS
tara:strand:- start:6386 stop:7258 length:873 start_codon:yes stop_codon:yes gene_type:complete